MGPVVVSVPFNIVPYQKENNSKKLNKFTLFRPIPWAATLYLASAASDHLTIEASNADVLLQ